jgi:hypothetical protein
MADPVTSNRNTPADPAPPGRLIVCFVPVHGAPVGTGFEGANMGACPLCRVQGVVGNYCYECLRLEGVTLGRCEVCGFEGPIGLPCDAHPTYEYGYNWQVPTGYCPLCDKKGSLGSYCTRCEDMAQVYL